MQGGVFLKISKASVYVLLFLLPLFFLPFTANVLEYQKQVLLFLLTLISLSCWVAYILTSDKLEVKKGLLDIAVLAFLLTALLSTLLSLFRYGSFWGFPLPGSSSFLALLSFAVLYFVIVNLFKKEEIPFLLLTLFASAFLGGLVFLFHAFGSFIIPFDFAQSRFFNTVGQVNALSLYFALLLILLLPLLFFVKRLFKFILAVFGITFLLVLLIVNFKAAWIVFLAGSSSLFALTAIGLKKARHSAFTALLMAFLVIGLLFTFSRFSFPWGLQGYFEVSPSQRASFQVLKEMGARQIIFGAGPGTFFYNWAKHKPQDINQTIFWDVRFSQPASEVLGQLTGKGILGLLAFLFLIGVCLRALFRQLLERTLEVKAAAAGNRFLLWGVFGGLLSLLVAFFLYPANFSLMLLFWLLVSFCALLGSSKTWVFDLQASSARAVAAPFSAVLILILGIGLAIIYGQQYAAEVRYYQGLKAFQAGEVEKAGEFILRATNLNPSIDVYWRDLSQVFSVQLQGLFARTDLSQEEAASRARSLIADTVNAAGQATVVDPQNVANWNIRGFVLRSMVGILGGAEDWALQSYEKARELEPGSPFIVTEIGRTYLAKSDVLAQQQKAEERAESLQLARQSFEKAIELKSDYAPAHFQIAMIHIREQKIAEAIEQLEETKLVAPFDTGLSFQLGLIYYNDGQLDKAKAELEKAVSIDPNYSNARYFLGLIADRQKDKSSAIAQFTKIEELNPDNQEIKSILANLRAGKAALEGISPGEPPIEEKPQEQLKK